MGFDTFFAQNRITLNILDLIVFLFYYYSFILYGNLTLALCDYSQFIRFFKLHLLIKPWKMSKKYKFKRA